MDVPHPSWGPDVQWTWRDAGSLRDLSEITLGDLRSDDVPAARRLVATAFAGEAFRVGTVGDVPVARFAGMAEQYRSFPESPDALVQAAYVGDQVVGVRWSRRAPVSATTATPSPSRLLHPRPGPSGSSSSSRASAGTCTSRPPYLRTCTSRPSPPSRSCRGPASDVESSSVWSAGSGATARECAVLECLSTLCDLLRAHRVPPGERVLRSRWARPAGPADADRRRRRAQRWASAPRSGRGSCTLATVSSGRESIEI